MSDSIRIQPFALNESVNVIKRKKTNPKSSEVPPFSEVLKASITKVNDMQVESDKLVQRLALGEVEDVSEVSIAVEKAELALRLMIQIRDKLVDAYQQIGRMAV
jgi:flagellar hook-basal body complex protein FliE